MERSTKIVLIIAIIIVAGLIGIQLFGGGGTAPAVQSQISGGGCGV